MKILFSGGGTLGPVTPLLALYDTFRAEYPHATFVFVGTTSGPEKALVDSCGIPFIAIPSGKFRRYLSVLTITDLFQIIGGFFYSVYVLWKESPSVCISAGGFVSVPLHAAAWLMGIPTWIHQQDVTVGLANRLMSFFATRITTSLEMHTKAFPTQKTSWIGNPVRNDILLGSKKEAIRLFGLDASLPVVFVTGGGTGSLRVNQLILEALPHLDGVCQVLHLSGKERPQEMIDHANLHFGHMYRGYQFFTDEMKHAYAIADVVVSRGGFGTLSELAALKKAAILIPKPGHQVENVSFLAKEKAVIVMDEQIETGLSLAQTIKQLLVQKDMRETMGEQLGAVIPLATPPQLVDIINDVLLAMDKE